MDDSKISQIKDTIIKELGLEGISEERKDEFLAKMGEVILKKVFLETMDKLNDQSKVQFESMLEKEAPSEDIEKFLSENISDFESMVEKVVVELKEDLMKTEEE
ncbi:MAG: hypothetical protein OEV93_02660 [Candidatus Moranbacteria bacterium]|nr:hypothetical protein [Candidatus Moranbacteria bacterium]